MKRPGGKGAVMVVEDDFAIRETLRELLEEEGYEVVWAANGHEALARLHGRPTPGLILLDLMMPVMDGWEFLVAQQDDPALAHIPVIVISADHAQRNVAQLDVAGYLPKPFEYDALLDTVQRYC